MNNGYGSAIGSPSPCEVRQLQVDAASNDLAYQVAELEQSLGVLAGRLSGVLSQGANAQAKGDVAPGYSCELASRIGCVADRIRAQRIGLNEILSRLEI